MKFPVAWALAAVSLGAPATADEAEGPVANQFTISPEDGARSFLCEHGYLQSVQTSAVADHRLVSIRLLDATGAAIPDGVWRRPAGFRLDHKANVIVRVVMICAPGP